MTAAARKPALPEKRAMLGKVHIAKKDLALAEDSYRALLERVTGKDSSAKCSQAQLHDVLAEFKRLGWKAKKTTPKRAGKRPMARDDKARKIRALWLDLYHIAAIRDPSEEALAAYVKRMTGGREVGTDALQWIDSYQADRVIKGLRGWLERKEHVFPVAESRRQIGEWRARAALPAVDAGFAEKVALLETQWRLLKESGTMKHAFFADLGSWLGRYFGASATHFLTPEKADSAIEELGQWLRRIARQGGGS